MLAVWCFTVFAAVGERLAVSGKSEKEEVEVVEDEEEEGGWMKSGRTPPTPPPTFFKGFLLQTYFY